MRQPADDGPMIVAQMGPYDGQRWVLHDGLTVGRDEDCEIVIPHRQVSRQHARFNLSDSGVWLEDLNSKNGTHHNGHLISEKVLLQDGDIVQIALAQQFVYLSSDATMPLNGDFEPPIVAEAHYGQKLLTLEKRSRRIWIKDQEIIPPLSVSQFRLLQTLYERSGQVVGRAQIIEAVWGEENAIAVSDQALDALVRRLRDRLAEVDPSHQFIVTVRGHGLRLENPELN